jgi:transposase-like protein
VESAKRFEEKLARIHQAVGSEKPSVLARILAIDPASIAAAKKRQQIPGGWVEIIAEKCEVSSDWLYFGKGTKRAGESSSAPASEPKAAVMEARVAALEAQNARLEADNRCLRELLESQKETLSLYREMRGNLGPTTTDAPASVQNAHMIDPLSDYDFNVF